MKSVDTLRAIYLPLFAVSSGIDAAAVAPLFLTTALLELLALPLLSRLSMRIGSPLTMLVVAGTGVMSFALLLLSQAYTTLVVSQVLYAVVAAGFQSIGLVLLSRTAGSDIGAGASAFMAVTQIGTILGALLPLAVHGYSIEIFLIAALFCGTGALIAVALHRPLARQ
jgi:SET family sugar efflux transporter-like MFS transporter